MWIGIVGKPPLCGMMDGVEKRRHSAGVVMEKAVYPPMELPS